ncbi:MAG: hypothetical protein K2P10_09380 [Oscillospiraceae bacterium]|nr:hypothetical protein [Oscillospiraceae bacterium]
MANLPFLLFEQAGTFCSFLVFSKYALSDMLNYREIRDACQSPVWAAGKPEERLTEEWGNGRILAEIQKFQGGKGDGTV